MTSDDIEVHTPFGETLADVEAVGLAALPVAKTVGQQAATKAILALCAALREAHEEIKQLRAELQEKQELIDDLREVNFGIAEQHEKIERLRAEVEKLREKEQYCLIKLQAAATDAERKRGSVADKKAEQP